MLLKKQIFELKSLKFNENSDFDYIKLINNIIECWMKFDIKIQSLHTSNIYALSKVINLEVKNGKYEILGTKCNFIEACFYNITYHKSATSIIDDLYFSIKNNYLLESHEFQWVCFGFFNSFNEKDHSDYYNFGNKIYKIISNVK